LRGQSLITIQTAHSSPWSLASTDKRVGMAVRWPLLLIRRHGAEPMSKDEREYQPATDGADAEGTVAVRSQNSAMTVLKDSAAGK
jgi:hypothetical protein